MKTTTSLVPLLVGMLLTGCAGLQAGNTVSAVKPGFTVAAGPRMPEPMETRRDLFYELLVGEIAGKRGDVDAATQHYRRASELSDDPQIAARTARIATFSKDFKVALEAAKRWVELEPESEEAHQVAGLLLVQNDEPEAALEHLARGVEQGGEEGYEISFARLSLLFARESVSPSELKALDLLRQRYSTVSHAHRTYAELAYRSGEHTEALAALDTTLELNPEDQAARILRNRVLIADGKVDEALQDMRALSKENPEDAELTHGLARMLVQAKRYEEALQQYKEAVRMQPQNFDLIYSQALLEIELKRYDGAMESLSKLADSPSHAEDAHYYLGRVEEERKHYEEALGWYVRILSGERFFEAQTRAAAMLGEMGQLTEAREHLARLRNQSDNESIQIRLFLAESELYRTAGKYQEGFDIVSEALEKHYPEDIDLLYARSMMAEKIGRVDLLEKDLRTVIRLEPDNATALNALGYTLADHSLRLDEALDFIKRALEIRPDDPAILDSMGWVNYRLGKLDEAEKYLNKALSQLEDPEIAGHLGEVLWVKGQHEEAKETVTRALESAPEDDRLLKLREKFTQ